MDRIDWIAERFEVLARWKVRHEYYREGICRCVELRPDRGIKCLLKRRGVRLKRLKVNEWALVGTREVSWDEGDEVVMEVKVNDPFWKYYTEGGLPDCLVWRPGEAGERELVCRAKRMRWEYVLLRKGEHEAGEFELKEAEGRLNFEIEGEVLMNGLKGIRMVSTQAVELRECYDYRLRLSERRMLGSKLIIKEMAFPVPGRFPECGENCVRAVVVV